MEDDDTSQSCIKDEIGKLMEGPMKQKRNTGLARMKDCYCIASRNHSPREEIYLHVYKSKKEYETKPNKTIASYLLKCVSLWNGKGNFHSYEHAFTFETNDQKLLYCSVSTPQEKLKWMNIMKANAVQQSSISDSHASQSISDVSTSQGYEKVNKISTSEVEKGSTADADSLFHYSSSPSGRKNSTVPSRESAASFSTDKIEPADWGVFGDSKQESKKYDVFDVENDFLLDLNDNDKTPALESDEFLFQDNGMSRFGAIDMSSSIQQHDGDLQDDVLRERLEREKSEKKMRKRVKKLENNRDRAAEMAAKRIEKMRNDAKNPMRKSFVRKSKIKQESESDLEEESERYSYGTRDDESLLFGGSQSSDDLYDKSFNSDKIFHNREEIPLKKKSKHNKPKVLALTMDDLLESSGHDQRREESISNDSKIATSMNEENDVYVEATDHHHHVETDKTKKKKKKKQEHRESLNDVDSPDELMEHVPQDTDILSDHDIENTTEVENVRMSSQLKEDTQDDFVDLFHENTENRDQTAKVEEKRLRRERKRLQRERERLEATETKVVAFADDLNDGSIENRAASVDIGEIFQDSIDERSQNEEKRLRKERKRLQREKERLEQEEEEAAAAAAVLVRQHLEAQREQEAERLRKEKKREKREKRERKREREQRHLEKIQREREKAELLEQARIAAEAEKIRKEEEKARRREKKMEKAERREQRRRDTTYTTPTKRIQMLKEENAKQKAKEEEQQNNIHENTELSNALVVVESSLPTTTANDIPSLANTKEIVETKEQSSSHNTSNVTVAATSSLPAATSSENGSNAAPSSAPSSTPIDTSVQVPGFAPPYPVGMYPQHTMYPPSGIPMYPPTYPQAYPQPYPNMYLPLFPPFLQAPPTSAPAYLPQGPPASGPGYFPPHYNIPSNGYSHPVAPSSAPAYNVGYPHGYSNHESSPNSLRKFSADMTHVETSGDDNFQSSTPVVYGPFLPSPTFKKTKLNKSDSDLINNHPDSALQSTSTVTQVNHMFSATNLPDVEKF